MAKSYKRWRAIAFLALSLIAQRGLADRSMPAFTTAQSIAQSESACASIVTSVAQRYLETVDLRDKTNLFYLDGDVLDLKRFESVSKGTYNQDFIAMFELKHVDAAPTPAAARIQQVTFVMNGDFYCENLKVRFVDETSRIRTRSAGGVERVDRPMGR